MIRIGRRERTDKILVALQRWAQSGSFNHIRSSAERTDLPVQKNDEAVIDIIGMNHDGEGVGRVEGFTLFVPGALPGKRYG